MLSLGTGFAQDKPKKDSYKITTNIPKFQLEFFKNDSLVSHHKIAVGKPSTPTPIGDYKIIRIEDTGGAYSGTVLVFDENRKAAFAVHGFHEDYTLGYAMSHGCIRMNKYQAKDIKALVSVDTPISNNYETIQIDALVNKIKFTTDFYSRGTNSFSSILLSLIDAGIPVLDLDIGKITTIADSLETMKQRYVAAAENLYSTYIQPLPDGINRNVTKRFPGILERQKQMDENYQLEVSIAYLKSEINPFYLDPRLPEKKNLQSFQKTFNNILFLY